MELSSIAVCSDWRETLWCTRHNVFYISASIGLEEHWTTGTKTKIAALFIFFIWIPISCFTQCLHLLKYYWWGTRLVIKLTVSLIISIFVSVHDRIRSVFTKSHLFRFIYFFGRGLWRCGISYILSGGSCRALSFALTHHIVIPRLLMLMS